MISVLTTLAQMAQSSPPSDAAGVVWAILLALIGGICWCCCKKDD